MHIEMQARVAGGEEAARWARQNAVNHVKPVEGCHPHVDAQQNVWMDSQTFVRWVDHRAACNAVQYGRENTGERYTLYSHDDGGSWFGPYYDRSPGASDAEDDEDLGADQDGEDHDDSRESEQASNSSDSQVSSKDSSVLSTSSGSGILSTSYSSDSSSSSSAITVDSAR